VGHVSRSGSLVHLKVCRDRISQSDLKTNGCATMGGACGIIVEVVSRGS
jgi:hypothetical protein